MTRRSIDRHKAAPMTPTLSRYLDNQRNENAAAAEGSELRELGRVTLPPIFIQWRLESGRR